MNPVKSASCCAITQNSRNVIIGDHALHAEVTGGKVITNFHARSHRGGKNKYLGLFKSFLL